MGNCVSIEEDSQLQGRRMRTNPNPDTNLDAGPTVLTTPKKSSPKINGVISVLAAPKNVEDLRQIGDYGNVNTFTYAELGAATKNFRPDQVLGEGGFGMVYKGLIDQTVRPGFTSTQVAVKVLNREGFQGDKEWLAEVNYLGQFSHPNLVRLIGYCCEDAHRLLVYEYMACGSLEKHLFRRLCITLPWSTRMKIALGAARGLAFLHGAERPIIYRDFKTSNILLDVDYNAKLSDFGLAKEGPMGDQTHVSTRVMGTYGYAAPEYVMTGHLTARSDVYGFGVVLLEMLIGRKTMDKSRPSREHNLVEWARPLLIHSRKLVKIVDPRMEGEYTNRALQKVAALAYQCLCQNPKGRPTMSKVVETLETIQEDLQYSDHESSRDQNMLLRTTCASTAVTVLYEIPKETSPGSLSMDRDQGKKHSSKKTRPQGEADPKSHCTRTTRSTQGRSRSEPPKEFQLYSPSPHSDGHQPSSVDELA